MSSKLFFEFKKSMFCPKLRFLHETSNRGGVGRAWGVGRLWGAVVWFTTRRYFLPLWCFWWLRCLVTGGSCDLVTPLVRVGLSSPPPPPWWCSSERTPLHLLTPLPAILASDSPPTGFYVATNTLDLGRGGFENYHQLTFF